MSPLQETSTLLCGIVVN